MDKICVVTSTRADYGLLRPLIAQIHQDPQLQLQLLVTGTHLSAEYGMTKKEILSDGFPIDHEIEIILSSDTPSAASKAMGLALIGCADYFAHQRPDLAVLLGDRFEIFAIAAALVNARIPLLHLCGGETTQGAVDECYRHSITKMAQLHCVSNEQYRRRVIQLGDSPERVHNTGETGIENIRNLVPTPLCELESTIGMALTSPLAVVTFHPVTMEDGTAEAQCQELFRALDAFPHMHFVITKANADAGGRTINRLVDQYAQNRPNVAAVTSLGMQRYLSLLSYADIAIGNSSSGIIEVPSFHIPTVNIGDRQKGRLQAASVINARPEANDIITAIRKALSEQHKAICATVENPYGDGRTTEKIMHVIRQYLQGPRPIQKTFYDLPFPSHD